MQSHDSDKIRVGVVGCGHWGKNYVRIFSSLPNSCVTAVCDLKGQRQAFIQEMYPSVRLFTDFEQLLTSDLCDAVVVATNASTHYNLTKKALESNLHVIAEKPLTLSIEEADELVRLSKDRDRILLVAHTFLYNPSILKIRQLLKEGAVGDVYYLKARRTHLGLVREDVSAIWDLAPHDISIFLYFLGQLPMSVQAMGGKYLKDSREDAAFINLRFPNGTIANIIVSWADANKERYLDIVGSKARIVFNDLDNLEPIRIYHKGISVDHEHNGFGEFQYLLRDGDIISPKVNQEEPLKALCKAFLESIDTKVPPLSDGKLGRDVVAVLCKIQEAISIRDEVYV